jgi:hypothetical protein
MAHAPSSLLSEMVCINKHVSSNLFCVSCAVDVQEGYAYRAVDIDTYIMNSKQGVTKGTQNRT